MRNIRITKLSDDKFNGVHPNGINEGFTSEGVESYPPEVGQNYYGGGLRTSVVTKIIDENTFKTLNSTYKIEEI